MEGKNLLNEVEEIKDRIMFAKLSDEKIISIEVNSDTKKHLNSLGIYGFGRNNEIEIIINENLFDKEVKVNREKMNIATPYEPYE